MRIKWLVTATYEYGLFLQAITPSNEVKQSGLMVSSQSYLSLHMQLLQMCYFCLYEAEESETILREWKMVVKIPKKSANFEYDIGSASVIFFARGVFWRS